jgi:hypothetical protein
LLFSESFFSLKILDVGINDVSEHIRQIIIELVVVMTEILSLDPEELILEIMSENQRLEKYII